MLISQIAALTSTHFRPCSLAILEDLKPTLRDPTFEHHFRRPCCCNLGAGQYAKITNKICIVSVAESEFKPASEPGPIRCSIDVNPQVCKPPSKLALPVASRPCVPAHRALLFAPLHPEVFTARTPRLTLSRAAAAAAYESCPVSEAACAASAAAQPAAAAVSPA